jgi:hypothetical protein
MTDFVSTSIGSSNEECVELFKKYKKKTENIYTGLIPRQEIFLSTHTEIYKDIEIYFLKQMYKENPVNNVFDPYLKKFVKLCWLTEEYLTVGFKNPIGVHYNPRLSKNIVHPGASRQQILSLFQDSDIDCIYFNTGGKQYYWMDRLKKKDIADFCIDDVFITLVPDHGSLIPHMHLNQESISSNVTRYQRLIQQRLSDFRVSTTVEIPFLAPWINSNSPNVIMEFNEHYTKGDMCKAIILSLLNKSYETNGLKLTCN